eukprot:1185054-Alexandrium_andersonii.AAC.1
MKPVQTAQHRLRQLQAVSSCTGLLLPSVALHSALRGTCALSLPYLSRPRDKAGLGIGHAAVRFASSRARARSSAP